jgi:hypothetical protein
MNEDLPQYECEKWIVRKDTMYAARVAIETGLEYAKECLSVHDINLGRGGIKNRVWAERMEADIVQMEKALKDVMSNPN